MTYNQYCVIMAGGYGNHFWPMSREDRPKQFLDIAGEGKSLVRTTYDRCKSLVPVENILIVTLERFSSFVQEQIPELSPENLLLEPHGRKTAPCVVYSTYSIIKRNPNAVIAMVPADQIIYDEEKYRKTLASALDYAEKNKVLMTIGVVPSRPDPNYGYIQASGGRIPKNSDGPVKVKTFTEKPDPALAEVFWKSGEFFWNSGIFVWQASVIKEECERFIPQITGLFLGWEGAIGTNSEKAFIEKAYIDCNKLSIDYGVMEKTEIAWLYPADFGWCDVDSWDAIYSTFPGKDDEGNAANCGPQYLDGVKNTIILSTDKKKMIALKGLEDYIVVDTPDVLMICPKDDKTYHDFLTGTTLQGFNDYK
ncbi:MAG: mannose-1-phosphate guanylyltransferase [Bacteroidales bacterium]|nr:mannose-1-phosphate guanylyltransferase [Bacteroidales bacterium]